MLDAMCRRYHQRPSEVVGLLDEDPALSIDFDMAVMLRGIKHENAQADKAREEAERRRTRSPMEAMGRLKERLDEPGRVVEEISFADVFSKN